MDVVGVGALNLDLITGASALNGGPVLARLGAHMRLRPPPESGGERMVDEPAVRAGLEWLRAEGVPLTPEPGGSAFNTLHALGRLGRGLRLGYVGVAGRDPLGAAGPSPSWTVSASTGGWWPGTRTGCAGSACPCTTAGSARC